MSVSALKPGTGWPLYEDLFRHLDIAIAIYEAVDDGADFRIIAMNPAALRISRTQRGEAVGCLLSETFSGAEVTGIVEALRRAHLGGRSESLPPLHHSNDLHDGWYRCDVHRLDGGQLVAMYTDVTEDYLAPSERQRRTLAGLYGIYRATQTTTASRDLVRTTAPIVAQAMQAPAEVFVSVEIDEEIAIAGECAAVGERLEVTIHDGHGIRGRITIGFSSAAPPLEEEQRFADAAALALGLWARGEKDRRSLETYEKIVSNTQDQLALIDEALRYRIVNRAYAQRVGRSPSNIVGRRIHDVLGNHGVGSTQEASLRKSLAGATVQRQEWRDTPDGERHMNILYSPYYQGDDIVGVIVSIHDITDLHAAQAQLRRTAQVFSSSAEAVVMTERDGTVTDVNEAFSTMFGYAEKDLIGGQLSPIDTTRHDEAFRTGMYASLGEQRRWRGEVFCRHRDGRTFPCLMTLCAVEDDQGEPTGYVSLFSDISAIKENEQRLETLAHHDPLTGLANRIQLGRHLERRVQRAEQEGNAFTLMFIDLDHFKDVNDTLGHSAGDDLLRMVTKRLLGALRADDMLARIGGDEFIAVLPGIDSGVNASVIAGKIITTVGQPYRIHGEIVQISASIGICSYPADGNDVEQLLENADLAMYSAKKLGRSGWQCYSAELDHPAGPG